MDDDDMHSDHTDDRKKQAHLALLDALEEAKRGIVQNTFEHDDDDEEEEEIPLSPVEPVVDDPLGESGMPNTASNAPFLAETSVEDELRPREFDGTLRDLNPSKNNDTVSISSESQRKLRPESVLMPLTKDPLILGIALVDFDHAVRIPFIPVCGLLMLCRSDLGSNSARVTFSSMMKK
jgi:hypothetical protein